MFATFRYSFMAGMVVIAVSSRLDVQAADTAKDAELFKKACGTCHAADRNAAARQGPNLFRVYGRTAGTDPGFRYSPGFKSASKGIVWNEESLDRWLTDPQAMMPGAVMLYKEPDPERRAAVIEYLSKLR